MATKKREEIKEEEEVVEGEIAVNSALDLVDARNDETQAMEDRTGDQAPQGRRRVRPLPTAGQPHVGTGTKGPLGGAAGARRYRVSPNRRGRSPTHPPDRRTRSARQHLADSRRMGRTRERTRSERSGNRPGLQAIPPGRRTHHPGRRGAGSTQRAARRRPPTAQRAVASDDRG